MSIITKIKITVLAIKSLIRREYQHIVASRNKKLKIQALRNAGIDISEKAVLFGDDIQIDKTRPSLIHIGAHTFLHNGFKLLTHDYSTFVFLKKYNDFVNSSGAVWIGDNVWFGENVTVLKGSKIGNNCIIGINSVVMGEIPNNSVAAGSPAKVICSIDEYYAKRKKKSVEEAFEYARSIKERFHRRPVPADFWEEFPLFVSGDEIEKYQQIPIYQQITNGGVILNDGKRNIRLCLNRLMSF